MLKPFSDRYQKTAHKQWAEMSSEEVSYIWRSNMVTGLGSVIMFSLIAIGFAALSVYFYGLVWWGWIFTPFVMLMLVSHVRERQEGKKMSTAEKVEAVERIQAIRREPLP
ncbi:MAG: hypothetical protein WCP03_01200 [Candidatus Saccharibacteria bacterium]